MAELEILAADIQDVNLKKQAESDMVALRAGIYGEDTVLYELKNSHIPMFILHNLYLEHEGLTAQIDFLIITKKRYFVVETKNYGNIIINNRGDFIRNMNGRKEGIYSPVTQSKRHLELIKVLRSAEKGNVITKTIFEKYFYENYRSVVVLANPKTILDSKYAPKDIKHQVIRADQLIDYIKKANSEKDAISGSESDTEKLARFYLDRHRSSTMDYLEKYRNTEGSTIDNAIEIEEASSEPKSLEPVCPRCGAPMIKRKASKGKNGGAEFWGCATFPKCRGIINT